MNEIWGSGCPEPTCENRGQVQCLVAENNCYCAEGYIRESRGGRCIKEAACPAPKCSGLNEHFECKCADKVCNEPEKICKRCLDGCYCDEGFVRDVEGGSCIESSQC